MDMRTHIRDRVKKIKAGELDPAQEAIAAAARLSINAHVDEFEAALTAKRNTAKHVTERVRMVREVVTVANLSRVSDLTPSKVQIAVHKLQDKGTKTRRTEYLNRYLKAMRQFSRWLVRNRKASIDPLAGLDYLTVTDSKEWGALTIEQEAKLVAAMATAKDKTRPCNIRPTDRAMMYRVAFATGLRANELRTLTRESFDLAAGTVTVQAAFSKHKRQDVLDLPDDLRADLGRWIASKGKGVRLWPLPADTAKMFRRDLRRAGLPEQDDQGRRFVFHSTRETLATRAAESGVTAHDAKAMLRHSTITLTMDTYAKHDRTRSKAAIERVSASKMLRASGSVGDALGLTGTDQEKSQNGDKSTGGDAKP
jgi:integrase